MDQPPADRIPDSWTDSWPAHAAMAVATGVATTYLPVQRWSRPARWALHGGLGALGAGAVAVGASQLGSDEPVGRSVQRTPPSRGAVAAMALGIGAVVAGISRGGQAVDAWTEDTLAARGVRRPRLWMGVVAAGASLAMSAADRRSPRRGLTP
jgi:hypothetical protein